MTATHAQDNIHAALTAFLARASAHPIQQMRRSRLSRPLAGAALLLTAVMAHAGPARLGSLLITLPGINAVQRVNLDQPQPLVEYTDRNAKGARFYAGNRHYFKIQSAGFKQDTLTAYAADTGQATYVASNIPRLSDVAPSPTASGVFLFTFLQVASDAGAFAIVDLASGHRMLASYNGEVGKYLHWWMPDGSLRRLHAHTGELSAWQGRLHGGNEQIDWRVIGALPPPSPGHVFATAALSPSGQELLLSTVEPRTRREDLWMADLRGGELQRVTRDGFVSFVRWSPDGRNLLLRRSNVSSIGTTFRGECAYWIIPAGARDVTGLVAGVAHGTARQVFHGAGRPPDSLPCGDVAAWLP